MAPVLTKHPISDTNENSRDSGDHESRKAKRKRSRWGEDTQRAAIPGMPTIIPANMTKEQEKAYLTQLRIEEITRMLRTGELGIPSNPENRSPSPEPIYDSNGKRLNTREVRARTKLEGERHKLVLEMFKLNSDYKPPVDYKAPSNKVVDKVFIPQEDHPDINFVGLLIGPRGNTLKMLEKDTNAKIIIRGKGSIKENKIGRSAGQPLPGEDEPLHAYITGATPEVVALACEKIREIIKQGIEVPETMNDLRRQQLRELALINGTLRENDSLNKLKLLQTAQTIVTNTIICGLCGSAGHITSDCKLRNSSESESATEKQPTWAEREKMDTEYLSLMAELGQGQAPDTSKSAGKCIINRNGSSAGPLLSIESNGTAFESGNAKTQSTEKTESETNSNQIATSSSDETIDGKKVIDMTQLARNPSQSNGSSIIPKAPAFLMGHQPSYFGEEDSSTSNIASAAMLYSQQMNYYAQMGVPPYPGMPMWPGPNGMPQMPPAPYGWPPMGSMAPPPPPPPPPSN